MVEIFTGPNCGYCAKAKALLDREGVEYHEYDVASTEHRDEYARRLSRSRSLPQVFANGEQVVGRISCSCTSGGSCANGSMAVARLRATSREPHPRRAARN